MSKIFLQRARQYILEIVQKTKTPPSTHRVTSHPKHSSFKQHAFVISVSVDQALSTAQLAPLLRVLEGYIQSGEWLGCILIWELDLRRSYTQVHMVVGRIKFLMVVVLKILSPKTTCCFLTHSTPPSPQAIHIITGCFFKASKSFSLQSVQSYTK